MRGAAFEGQESENGVGGGAIISLIECFAAMGLESYSDGRASTALSKELSNVPSGLKRAGSLKRARPIRELVQLTIPQEQWQETRPPTSTDRAAGIFPTHRRNPSGPKDCTSDQVVVRIDSSDSAAATATERAHQCPGVSEGVSTGSPHANDWQPQSRSSEIVSEPATPREDRPRLPSLTEIAFFDNMDHFQRRRGSLPTRRKDSRHDLGVAAESYPDPSTPLIGTFRDKSRGNKHFMKDLDLLAVTNDLGPRPLRTGSMPILFPTSFQRASTPVVNQPAECNFDPSRWHRREVSISMEGDDTRHAKRGNLEVFRASSPKNGNAGELDSRGLKWRRNSSFGPRPSPTELEAFKSRAEFPARPTLRRLKSRLADIPKPPEMSKALVPIDDKTKAGKGVKSGLLGNKLKKVAEEEEEDPLKSAEFPVKCRRKQKGFLVVFQRVAFILSFSFLIINVTFPSLRSLTLEGLFLWKWGLLAMVVLSGRLISGWIIWVVVFVIEKNFLLRKGVVYFVYALRKGVVNCVWIGLALMIWLLMINPKADSKIEAVKYVTKVLVCLLVATVIIVVKTLMIKVFASSFHVNNYFERIQDALFDQYIMETLTGPPEFQLNVEDEKISRLQDAVAGVSGRSLIPELPPLNLGRSNGLGRQSSNLNGGAMCTQSDIIGKSLMTVDARLNEGISVKLLQKLNLKNISAWSMKRLLHVVKKSTLTHALEKSMNADVLETEIQSEWQAKCAAKEIFNNVAKPGHKVIMEDDFLRFMREEETRRAWPLFEGAVEMRIITKKSLKTWVINAYRERRALALSLNDTKTAVQKLHTVLNVLVGFIIVVIWLLALGIVSSKTLLFMSSQVLLLILAWGTPLRSVFEAVVFVFIMHPFDVGDRCIIDGKQLVVEEMNILTTVFLGDCNVKIWISNAVLATKPIENYYRSPNMGDGLDLVVHANTPVENIAAFKEKIGGYIASKPHHWQQNYTLNVLQMTAGDRMKLWLGVHHTMNYQDISEISKRRSDLLLEVRLRLQELGIEYQLPIQEVRITRVQALNKSPKSAEPSSPRLPPAGSPKIGS